MVEKKIFYFFLNFILSPLVIYFQMIHILKYPCIKFICQMLSFISFLVLIIISTAESSQTTSSTNSLRTQHKDLHTVYSSFKSFTNGTFMGDDFPMRPLFPSITEFLISIWVFGNYDKWASIDSLIVLESLLKFQFKLCCLVTAYNTEYNTSNKAARI